MANILTVVRQANTSPLGETAPARLPIGELIAQSATGQAQTDEAIGASIGVWESSPGVFRRHLKNKEFSHIVSGWCIFTPDGGEPVELRAGDAVLFPENCEGIWDIRETFRKTYLLF
ncbi:cupin domain-containing protein [Pseudomonas sp. NPDC089547]|uniref:cupin domain-containing protein n=1 Tax=Pseudomonas sp. NPDC089547 TaxID=3390652 RepID=UPI003D007F52